MLSKENMKVLINVIGAVESGGQIYGNRRYEAYANPGQNSSNEVTITLGWAQNYGNNARELIQRIFDKDYRLPTAKGKYTSDIDYVRWALNIAADDRYYYGHSSDPFSFSCSTMVGKALYVCGYIKNDPEPEDGSAIGGTKIDNCLLEAKFSRKAWSQAGGLKEGDILIVDPYHIAIHVKDGIMVAANGNGNIVDKSATAITTYNYKLVGNPKYVWRPTKVNKIHCSDIEKMLKKDWIALKWNPTATQKQKLIDLISSPIGKECQDEMFADMVKPYITDCEKQYTTDPRAVMMYCEIRHLGGKNAAERIFNRCNKNYSLDNIMAALKQDQADGNNNQVGDKLYWSRHEKCREFIQKYAKVDSDPTGYNTTNLKVGDRGPAVKLMQEKLIAAGYNCGPAGADGEFGFATDIALKNFQLNNGLEDDGVYGPKTEAALEKALEKILTQYKYDGVDYSPVFDPDYYYKKYADLRKAFGKDKDKLFNHFCSYGMVEGRQAHAKFNVAKYRSYYPDLRKAFGTKLHLYYKHYCEYGKNEGRKAV